MKHWTLFSQLYTSKIRKLYSVLANILCVFLWAQI